MTVLLQRNEKSSKYKLPELSRQELRKLAEKREIRAHLKQKWKGFLPWLSSTNISKAQVERILRITYFMEISSFLKFHFWVSEPEKMSLLKGCFHLELMNRNYNMIFLESELSNN